MSDDEGVIRVAVVDDQRLFTKGLSRIVDLQPGMEVVGEAYDGEQAVALCQEKEPDVVLMDISMPKMDGITATREIKNLLPQTAVIILTAHEEDEHVFEGVKAGALKGTCSRIPNPRISNALSAWSTPGTLSLPPISPRRCSGPLKRPRPGARGSPHH